MPDLLTRFFSENHAAFIGGFHSLLQDAPGRRAYLNSLATNKRIDAIDLSHTFTVARIIGWYKRIVEESVQGSSGNKPDTVAGAGV